MEANDPHQSADDWREKTGAAYTYAESSPRIITE